jgi:hypothetical protein
VLIGAVLAASLRAGLPLSDALVKSGTAWPGAVGGYLAQVGEALGKHGQWEAAWTMAQLDGGPDKGTSDAAKRFLGRDKGTSDAAKRFLDQVQRALWLVWRSGVEGAPLLEAAVQRAQRAERRRLSKAAARLGVQLMVPLGLCYLPAFVALGLLPVMLSFAQGLLPAL